MASAPEIARELGLPEVFGGVASDDDEEVAASHLAAARVGAHACQLVGLDGGERRFDPRSQLVPGGDEVCRREGVIVKLVLALTRKRLPALDHEQVLLGVAEGMADQHGDAVGPGAGGRQCNPFASND